MLKNMIYQKLVPSFFHQNCAFWFADCVLRAAFYSVQPHSSACVTPIIIYYYTLFHSVRKINDDVKSQWDYTTIAGVHSHTLCISRCRRLGDKLLQVYNSYIHRSLELGVKLMSSHWMHYSPQTACQGVANPNNEVLSPTASSFFYLLVQDDSSSCM